jgi:uroporphyrinogen-III synthase
MAYAVVTREAEAYAAAFAAVGLEVVTMPVTRSEPPEDEGALARAIAAGGYAAIVCASARAAHALAVARGHTAIGEVWAIGPATAQALEAAGIAAIVPEVRDGAGLARALVAARSVAGTRILVPRAEDGRDDAIEILRAAGAEVEAIAAYRTVACDPDDPAVARGRELLERGAAAACALFAPSQVAALARIVPLTAIATRFIAIGETTARALREAGVAVAAVAESPTPEGMARALAAVYSPAP